MAIYEGLNVKKFSRAMFNACLVSAILLFGTSTAFAKPPGETRDSDVGKKLWQFNILAIPASSNWEDSNASCRGSRMFFDEGENGSIVWILDPEAHGFEITDCDGTDGAGAVVADESQRFYVLIRLLGPNYSDVDLRCVNTLESDNKDDLCIIDTVNLTKHGETGLVKIFKKLFDNELERVTWNWSGNYKLMQVRVHAITP